MIARPALAALASLAMLLSSASAHADDGPPPQPPEVRALYDLSTGLAIGGVVVTIGGGAVAILGGVSALIAALSEADGTAWAIGAGIGALGLFGGITMLVSARRTHHYADRRRDALALSASLAPIPSGGLVTLTLAL